MVFKGFIDELKPLKTKENLHIYKTSAIEDIDIRNQFSYYCDMIIS